jgi:adenine-specific DNA-methyltransferase
MDPYLKRQIITYMGNKRKLLKDISNVIAIIKEELNNKDLITADAFSGSGIVSRLLKNVSKTLYCNDIAGYSLTLNRCFLSNPTEKEQVEICKLIDDANKFASLAGDGGAPKWIREHWAPTGEIYKENRVYYTENNALLIDKYSYFIYSLGGGVPDKYKCYLLAMLLVKCSIHNNTNGQFSAFYKDENLCGKYGGKKEIDVKRITKNIILEYPIFSPNKCNAVVSQLDVKDWIQKIPEVDIMYLDPPYNKHPYSIYYFMLDIINDWDTNLVIPNTNRGQPKNWMKSDYNSFVKAETTFADLIHNIKAKFIILSYNNKGIIPITTLEKILEKKGKVYKYPVNHKTYNKLKGIASYKRTSQWEDVKEFIWMVDTR